MTTPTPTSQPQTQPQSESRTPSRHLFTHDIDNTSLVAWRVGFAAILIWEIIRFVSSDRLGNYQLLPFHFPYAGFEWVQPLPGPYLERFFYALGLACAAMGLGLFYRTSAALVWLGFTYIFLLEQAYYLNHIYLVCLLAFMMIIVPAHRGLSLDALRRPELRSNKSPGWALWILRLQLLIVFVWAGANKLNSDWLCGAPMRYWLASRSDHPLFGQFADSAVLLWTFVWAGAAFDLLVVPALLWRRTRWPALVAWCAFHLTNAAFFDIGIFPWMMLAAVILLLPAGLLRGQLNDGTTASSQPVSVPLKLFFVVWIASQALLPARHLLWDGWVDWTEEGHGYAWRMKLRGKAGRAEFTATHPESGETWVIRPEEFLSPKQTRKMPGRPELSRGFAHWLAKRFEEKGYEGVTIHGNVRVSLNGRKAQTIIDPTVDLAQVPWTWSKADWILPLEEQRPFCGWTVKEQP